MGSLMFAEAQHINAQAKIDAARITQKSGNEKRGAISQLGRFSQNLANQRRMEAAGDEIGNIAENLARNLDASTRGKLSLRVQAAEEVGASLAEAAAAGVGGSSIEQFNSTLSLSNAMAEEVGDRAVNTQIIAAGQEGAAVLKDAVAGLGNDVIQADQDFTQYVDHNKQGFFSRMSTLALAAGATYFGGPQAGMAVLQANEGLQQAKNGDFAGASDSVMGALSSAGAGVKTFRAGGAWGDNAYKKAISGVKGLTGKLPNGQQAPVGTIARY